MSKRLKIKAAANKDPAAYRASLLEELGTARSTEEWASSPNPLKRRIGALEAAWRETMQWMLEDIRKMMLNFNVIADQYTTLDINLAVLKLILIRKGITTHEEFDSARKAVAKYAEELHQKSLREAEEMRARKEEEARNAPPVDDDEDPHFPKSAMIFGG